MSEDVRLSTWGVKVSDEVREKIKNAMEVSGLQGKDFIESMVSLYEAQMMKDSQPIVAQEITELETITRRIINMYVGLGERVKTVLDEKERQHQDKQEQDKETIRLLHTKIRELEEEKRNSGENQARIQQEAEALQKQKVTLENEYITKVNGLTELQSSNRALIEEYKKKNDTLTGLIGEYKHYKDALQAIKAEEEVREKEVKELHSNLTEAKNELESLQRALTDEREKHRAATENLTTKLTLDGERQSLKLEKEYQGQIQSVRDEYNQQVRSLLTHMQQLQEKQPPQETKKTKTSP